MIDPGIAAGLPAYRQSVVLDTCEATGATITGATLRGWRHRDGLSMGSGSGWFSFSDIETLAIATIAHLTQHGFEAAYIIRNLPGLDVFEHVMRRAVLAIPYPDATASRDPFVPDPDVDHHAVIVRQKAGLTFDIGLLREFEIAAAHARGQPVTTLNLAALAHAIRAALVVHPAWRAAMDRLIGDDLP